MANIRSAKKRWRQTLKRTERNRSGRSKLRTYLRRAEEALSSGDKAAAEAAMAAAVPVIARAAGKGLLPANTASRKISRLTKRLNAI
ncbi:MAG: 30S ribosomal protein S20 [Alphaproteobacteria bacterium]